LNHQEQLIFSQKPLPFTYQHKKEAFHSTSFSRSQKPLTSHLKPSPQTQEKREGPNGQMEREGDHITGL
jgi:hypothetical protein